jgi:hypothetical protein
MLLRTIRGGWRGTLRSTLPLLFRPRLFACERLTFLPFLFHLFLLPFLFLLSLSSTSTLLPPSSRYLSLLPPSHSWESFRFILHFLGDVHQPMHLTSRERGGNGDPVLWEGRRTNLHSLWDGLLIARTLREQSNYTRALPSYVVFPLFLPAFLPSSPSSAQWRRY